MNKQELIKKLEERKTIIGNFQGYAVWWEDIKAIFEELDEPSSEHAEEAPRYVKDILARLRELPTHDIKVWLKTIISEFERDFSYGTWREGYEQGKIEGALEREKVKIPQFVADIIEEYKNRNAPIIDIFTEKNFNKKYNWWLATSLNAYDKAARAWLDGYEVEKEKRYLVTLKNGQPLVKSQLGNTLYFNQNITAGNYKASHKELEDAGFGWVFDCPGIQIEEVQDERKNI